MRLFPAICKVVARPVGKHLFPVNAVRRLRRRFRRNSAALAQRRSRSVRLCDKNRPFVTSGHRATTQSPSPEFKDWIIKSWKKFSVERVVTLPSRLWRPAAVALFIMPALEGPAGAGPLDDARAASQRGDYATEFRLLRPLALQGNAEAQTALGLMYNTGLGVLQDYVEAVKWYRCAADQGFADAQDALARMYFNGWGVPKDYVQAHMWANLAASSSSGTGFNEEAGLRGNIAADMTPAQITEAQRRAREWRPTTPRECR
jgi:hypothetical protein